MSRPAILGDPNSLIKHKCCPKCKQSDQGFILTTIERAYVNISFDGDNVGPYYEPSVIKELATAECPACFHKFRFKERD